MDFKSLILIVFGLSFTFCSHFPFRKYYYISTPKTWKDAQLYCRENHVDLATFESMEDVNQLTRPADITGYAWIGLHDDTVSWKGTLGNDSNSWRWSTTGQPITSQYYNFKNGEPNNKAAKQHCGFIEITQWNDFDCNIVKPFVCYTDVGQNQKTYVFISTAKSWSDAQTYCRQHYTDLAVITNSEENSRVLSVKGSTYPWIGLSRVPWSWSDLTPPTFTNWLSGQPNNYQNKEFCVMEHADHQWHDGPCLTELPFICYEVRKSKSTIKVQMKTTADLNDPAVKEQILQKINEALKSQGWTDPKLRWTTSPSKAQEKLPETQLCAF